VIVAIGPKWPGLIIMSWMLSVFCPGWNIDDDDVREAVYGYASTLVLPKNQRREYEGIWDTYYAARGYPSSKPPMTSLPPTAAETRWMTTEPSGGY
jgi:hypothetical protein